jgi:hypothetical protein
MHCLCGEKEKKGIGQSKKTNRKILLRKKGKLQVQFTVYSIGPATSVFKRAFPFQAFFRDHRPLDFNDSNRELRLQQVNPSNLKSCNLPKLQF